MAIFLYSVLLVYIASKENYKKRNNFMYYKEKHNFMSSYIIINHHQSIYMKKKRLFLSIVFFCKMVSQQWLDFTENIHKLRKYTLHYQANTAILINKVFLIKGQERFPKLERLISDEHESLHKTCK